MFQDRQSTLLKPENMTPSLWLAYDIAQLFHMTIEEVFIFKESERK